MREGRLRGLGQAGARRWAQMAELPTYREQGIDIVGSASRGFAAPGNLPPAIRERLEATFAAVLADPAFVAEAERLGMPLMPVVGAEYRALVLRTEAEYRALWQRRPWRDQ
jgi:tripartite-type tricarboxylate transporter receptor subunit TctC